MVDEIMYPFVAGVVSSLQDTASFRPNRLDAGANKETGAIVESRLVSEYSLFVRLRIFLRKENAERLKEMTNLLQ